MMDRESGIDFDRVIEVRDEMVDTLREYNMNYRECVVLLHTLHTDIEVLFEDEKGGKNE